MLQHIDANSGALPDVISFDSGYGSEHVNINLYPYQHPCHMALPATGAETIDFSHVALFLNMIV